MLNYYLSDIRRSAQYFLNSTILAAALFTTCGEPLPLNPNPSPISDEENNSPPPKQIAYFTSDGTEDQLVLANESGIETKVYSLPWQAPLHRAPCWSPDGTKILLYPAEIDDQGLYLLDISTGDLTSLFKAEGWNLHNPSWSPTGEITFLGSEMQEGELQPSELFVLQGTEMRRITHDSNQNYSPAWSLEGRLAYVASTSDVIRPGSRVYLYQDEHQQELSTMQPYVNKLAWSPDGTKLAFLGGEFGETNLYTISSEGGRAELQANLNGKNLQWAPDGSYLMLDDGPTSLSHNLYRFDMAQRQLNRLTAEGSEGSPAISPDGQDILFLSDRAGGRNLFKMNKDGTNIQQLTFLENPDWAYPAEWQGYCRRSLINITYVFSSFTFFFT